MSPSQWDLTRLGLVGNADAAARELAKECPAVVFTSGRRSREDQALAMAANIVAGGRQWINRTYKASMARESCQKWVIANPTAVTREEISTGLLSVLDGLTAEELSHLTKHLSGEAFDVRPVGGLTGQMILMSLRRITKQHDGKFIEREGGLTVWHAQF